MRRLFGERNYFTGSDKMFKSNFNAQIENKRLVYCDEFMIQEREDEDRLKLIVNDFIEIEKKGIDTKMQKNYANFYMSSNNIDSIRLSGDDRRFSMVMLTEKKFDWKQADIEALLSDENIKLFAQFLWNLEIDSSEMRSVFRSEKTEEVRSSSLKAWEEYFVFEYCVKNSNKKILLSDASDELENEFNIKIGRSRFIKLSTIYPKVFKVKKEIRNDRQVWVLDIKDNNENGKLVIL